MVKELLKTKEPLVYASLKNDLNNQRLAHSYLLCGAKSPLKLKTAYLLAQSIIESRNDFACEECETCKRILNNNHLDVLFIDGKDELIKKEDLSIVLNEFAKTALEKTAKKVYIINNINNATSKVLNMILKFMEEPSNENTYGIFISDDVSSLLETVVSRCEKLNFISYDLSDVKKEYLDNGVNELDAYLLSETLKEYVEDLDNYYVAKDYVIKFIDNLNDPYYLPVMLYTDVFPLKEFKEISDYFISLMIKLLDDALVMVKLDDEDYDDLLKKLDSKKTLLMEAFMNAKAKLEHNQSLDRKLLFDEICCKIIEEK